MNTQQIKNVIDDNYILNGSFATSGKRLILDMNMFPPSTIWMMTNKGGWCFIPQEIDVYRCHFGYNKSGLGEHALNHSKQCFENMRTLNAKILIGHVASKNKLALKFLKKLGCESIDRIIGDYSIYGQKTDLEVIIWHS